MRSIRTLQVCTEGAVRSSQG